MLLKLVSAAAVGIVLASIASAEQSPSTTDAGSIASDLSRRDIGDAARDRRRSHVRQ